LRAGIDGASIVSQTISQQEEAIMSPLLRLWKNALHASATRQAAAKRRRRARVGPRLELLEDRLAPAILTWTGQVSALWSDAGNWAEGTTPYNTIEDDRLIFPRTGARRESFHDGTPTEISDIFFQDSGYTIQGGDLTLTGLASIFDDTPGGTNTIENRSLTIATSIVFDINPNNELRVSSTISGGTINYNSQAGGTLALLGNNSYAGGTNVHNGATLVVGSSTALGTGRVVLGSGTLESSTSVTLRNPIDVVGTSKVSALDSGFWDTVLTGSVQIGAGATLTDTHTSGFVMFDGVVFGPGRLTKTGTGTLYLNAANTYEGGTEVSAGFLGLTNNSALGRGGLDLKGGIVEASWLTLPQRSVPLTLANSFVVSGGTISSSRDTFNLTGNGRLNGELAVTDYPEIRATITFSGALAGSGSLTTKDSRSHFYGTIVLAGTAGNTYSGTTTVTSGKLVLKKPSGVNAIAANLVIGDGVGGTGADVVSLGAPNQIADTTPITINSSGLLKLNNFSDKYGPVTGAGKIVTADPPTMTVAFDDLSATFEGEISGPGIVVKDGTGTWILTGDNTYEGGTIIAGGTLLVDGSIVSPVTVEAGATLGGTGTTGPVTLGPGAAVSPGGDAPGTQTVQDLALSPGSSFAVQLNGPDPGTGYDQLVVAGSVNLNEAILDGSLGFSPDPGQRFVIIRNDGPDPVSGTFVGLPQGAALQIGGVGFHIYYDRGDGNDVELDRNIPPTVTVPGDQTAFQNVELTLGGIQVTDPDDTSLTVTLQVSHGMLRLGTVAGLTGSGNGTSWVSLSGRIEDLNAALTNLVYLGDPNYSGPDLLTIRASDGLDTTSASAAIRVKSLAEQAADLRAQVEGLRATGVLNRGRANSLVVKLDLKDNGGDIGRVQAFLNEIAALLNAGILSRVEADALLTPGNILLVGLRLR
jgi:autotransporter-associated beta strand protein